MKWLSLPTELTSPFSRPARVVPNRNRSLIVEDLEDAACSRRAFNRF